MAYLREVGMRLLKLEPEQVSRVRPDAPLVETLLLDSISQIELMFEIEGHYGFQFELEEMQQLGTIKDLISLIQASASGR